MTAAPAGPAGPHSSARSPSMDACRLVDTDTPLFFHSATHRYVENTKHLLAQESQPRLSPQESQPSLSPQESQPSLSPLTPAGKGPLATVCWKCGGSGSVRVKGVKTVRGPKVVTEGGAGATVDGKTAVAPQPRRSPAAMKPCAPCKGTGHQLEPSNGASKKQKPAVRPFKALEGWTMRGPAPRGNVESAATGRDGGDWAPRPGEMLTSLAGGWMIYQLCDQHRYTTDDVCTAAIALRVVGALAASREFQSQPTPIKYLDIGTGLGSVLGMVTWGLLADHSSTTHLVRAAGIEAQTTHVQLALRTAAYNGTVPLTTIIHGDLRDLAAGSLVPPDGPNSYDLVTGTPPYFPTTHGSLPTHPQRGMCSFELRGGIETYMQAAAKALTRDNPEARFVVCQTGREIPRTEHAASEVGFKVVQRWDVYGRSKDSNSRNFPLFCVFVCSWKGDDGEASYERPTYPVHLLHVRDETGNFSPMMRQLMFAVGKPVIL
ncbi:hypothetical protein DFJ77DRAFT_460846 [Powellomyces hirtus]|nr:hypothetical protein DFJ77DRAFT_460846 [Powellomyces hirtus]